MTRLFEGENVKYVALRVKIGSATNYGQRADLAVHHRDARRFVRVGRRFLR